MTLFLALMTAAPIGCGPYTVEAWWEDQADGFCACNFPENQDECFDRQMASYQDSEFWSSCYDDLAPVERAEVRVWYRDYTENCQQPSSEEPSAENPDWFEECQQ